MSDKCLFVLDRPNCPRNIDLFRLWDEPKFRELNIYDLNDLLVDNIIVAPEHLGRDSEELYQLVFEFVPMHRTDNGMLEVLGRNIREIKCIADDYDGDLLPLHQMVENAAARHVMDWGLRVKEPAYLHHAYLTFDQLRGSIDPIVVGIHRYTLTHERARVTTRNQVLKITVALMLKNDLIRDVSETTGYAIMQTDNRGYIPNTTDLIGIHGIGGHELWKHIREDGYDGTIVHMPGLE